jgi:hypothetical protein
MNTKAWTPWGIADDVKVVRSGVRWYSTPGHGGLAVSKGVAEKMLSDAARYAGSYANGYFWFEEDCQYAIPLYEHPEWQAGLFVYTFEKDRLLEIIKMYDQQYLDNLANGFIIGKIPKVGDRVRFNEDVTFGGFLVKTGNTLPVISVTSSKVGMHGGHARFMMHLEDFLSKKVEVV